MSDPGEAHAIDNSQDDATGADRHRNTQSGEQHIVEVGQIRRDETPEDEPTTILIAGSEFQDDRQPPMPPVLVSEPEAVHDIPEDEPTTILLAEPALDDGVPEDEPTTILIAEPEAFDHGVPEDEPTTIVLADPETSDDGTPADEPTTIMVADPGRDEDEATTIVQATEPEPAPTWQADTLPGPGDVATRHAEGLHKSAESAWQDYEAEEPTTLTAGPVETHEPADSTEILPAFLEGATLEGGSQERAWFDGRLQEFTTALQQDEAGRPRPPQERQMLAASARDMIARVAMHRARAAEGWAADTVLQPDQLLANTYVVRSLIARGGVGEIYRTRHRDLKTEHAVKILLPRYALDPTLLTMMLDEARLLQCVRHEAVVFCQDLLRDADGRPMIVMDYLRGRTLSNRLREGRLPPADLIVLARRLADGLTAIHAAGIVHQDISPDNVILVEDSCAAATIIDFGLARSLGSVRDTQRNLDFAGKFSWSSPEQLTGRLSAVDARSDLYSLGLMLAAAARGYRLDMGVDLESARAARTNVPSLAGIEEPIAGLLQVLLAPSPSARLNAAGEIHPMLTPRPPTMLRKLQKLFGR